MNLRTLIQQLQAIEAEYGGELQAVVKLPGEPAEPLHEPYVREVLDLRGPSQFELVLLA